MIRHFLRAIVRHIADWNAKLTRRRDFHRVKTNPIANEGDTVLQSGHARRTNRRVMPDDHRPRLTDLIGEVRIALAKKSPHFGLVPDDRFFDKGSRIAQW